MKKNYFTVAVIEKAEDSGYLEKRFTTTSNHGDHRV